MRFHTLAVKISLGILLCQWEKSGVLRGVHFPVYCPKLLMERGMRCRTTGKQELLCGTWLSSVQQVRGCALVFEMMPGSNWL